MMTIVNRQTSADWNDAPFGASWSQTRKYTGSVILVHHCQVRLLPEHQRLQKGMHIAVWLMENHVCFAVEQRDDAAGAMTLCKELMGATCLSKILGSIEGYRGIGVSGYRLDENPRRSALREVRMLNVVPRRMQRAQRLQQRDDTLDAVCVYKALDVDSKK
jgi:hypothetical protein